MAKPTIKFEETMKRDVPLVFVEAWYKALTKEMNTLFGFDFPDVIFIYNKGYVTSYRAPSIFHKEIPLKIAEWLKNKENEEKLLRTFDFFVDLYQKINAKKKNLRKKCSPAEALKELKSCVDNFIHGVQGDIIAYWLPIWDETEVKKSGKHLYTETVLNSGKEARKKADPVFDVSADIIYHYIRLIAEANSWSENTLFTLLLGEMKHAVQNNKLPDVEGRKERYLYVANSVVNDKDIESVLKKKSYILKKDESEGKTLVKGTVAYPGTVSGIAKIILTRKQFANLNKEDILITSMTTPAFYPLLAKASAFVTDEGGMLCHAAIVSREMKKPCIIGTKIATKVFKDGDIIEVNGIKCTVRKI